jgi:hypothetical protein
MDSNKIDIFKLEAFFAKYEFVAKYLLCCSGKFWIVPEVDASCGLILLLCGVFFYL